MNTVLAIDTSSVSSSAAILRKGLLLAETTQRNPHKQHCEGLMPMLDQCLAMAQTDPNELDVIACTSGPGSFTGIRIGAAAAKGLAHALGIGIIAVPTLDALAYNVFNASSLIVPIMDARRGQVYTSRYLRPISNPAKPERVWEYECVPLAGLLSSLRDLGKTATFTGDGLGTFQDAITAAGHCTAPENARHVRASSVGLLALDMIRDGCEPLGYGAFTPFYLRKPQAERELEERSGAQT